MCCHRSKNRKFEIRILHTYTAVIYAEQQADEKNSNTNASPKKINIK